METRFSKIQETIRGRWRSEWSKDAAFSRIGQTFNGTFHVLDALCSKSDALRSSKRYSAQGLTDEIRAIAEKDTVPALRRGVHVLEEVQAEIKAKLDTLAIPKADPNDQVAATLRGEMRAWLRSLPLAERMQNLMQKDADQRLLLAAMEVPPAMVGLTDQSRDQVRTHIMRQRHSKELERLDELQEAVDVTNAAVGVSLYQLREETGFKQNDGQFDNWMRAASVEADRQYLAEQGKRPHETSSLPVPESDFGRQIEKTFDEIWAKAFPQLYPNHPINQQG